MSWLNIGKSFIPSNALSTEINISIEKEKKKKKEKKRKRDDNDQHEQSTGMEDVASRQKYSIAHQDIEQEPLYIEDLQSSNSISRNQNKLLHMDNYISYVIDKKGDRNSLTNNSHDEWDQYDNFIYDIFTSTQRYKYKQKQILDMSMMINDRCSKKLRYFGQISISKTLSFDVKRLRIPLLLSHKKDLHSHIKREKFLASYSGYIPLPPVIIENQNNAKIYEESDFEYNERILKEKRKLLNITTREYPYQVEAWLDLTVAQNQLAALQSDISGLQAVFSYQRRVSFCDWSNRPVIERQISILEEACRQSEVCQRNTDLQLLLLRFRSVLLPFEDCVSYWNTLMESSPLNVELRRTYLTSYAYRAISAIITPPSIVITAHDDDSQPNYYKHASIEGIANKILNAVAAERVTADLMAGFMSPADYTSSSPSLTSASYSQEQQQQQKQNESMVDFKTDLLRDFLYFETMKGRTERVVATIQAILLLNVFMGDISLNYQGRCECIDKLWDTSVPRPGDPTFISLGPSQQSGSDVFYILATQGMKAVENIYNVTSEVVTRAGIRARILASLSSTVLTSLEQEHHQQQEHIQQSTVNDAHRIELASSAESSASMYGQEVRADGVYVYSRVHGYKIKIAESDSSLPYKKILGELSDFSDPNVDLVNMTSEEILNMHAKKATVQVEEPDDVSIDDEYKVKGYIERCLDQLQWQPLRALESPVNTSAAPYAGNVMAEIDSTTTAVITTSIVHTGGDTNEEQEKVEEEEEELERVVLLDDIQPLLFNITPTSTAHISQQYHQSATTSHRNIPPNLLTFVLDRLVVTCLHTLGVHFPSTTESSSSLNNRLHPLLSERYLTTDLYSLLTRRSSANILDNVNLNNKTNRVHNILASQRILSADRGRNTTSTLLHFVLGNEVTFCETKLLENHAFCCSQQGAGESQLSFCIRLISQLISSPVHISEAMNVQLKCALISVLTEAVLVMGSNNLTNTSFYAEEVSRLRQICRSIVLSAKIPNSAVGATVFLSSHTIAESIAACFDMSVWCSYVLAEVKLGCLAEAKKMCRKAVTALVSDILTEVQKYPPSLWTGSVFDIVVRVPGALQLVYQAVMLELNVWSNEEMTRNSVSDCLGLIVNIVQGVVPAAAAVGAKKKKKGGFNTTTYQHHQQSSVNPLAILDVTATLSSTLEHLLATILLRISPIISSQNLAIDPVAVDPSTTLQISFLVFNVCSLAWTKVLSFLHAHTGSGESVGSTRETETGTELFQSVVEEADAFFSSVTDRFITALTSGGHSVSDANRQPLSSTIAMSGDGLTDLSSSPMVLLIEQLHVKRVEFLQAVQHLRSCINKVHRLPLSNVWLHSKISSALLSALADFPLNSTLLNLFVTLKCQTFRGILDVKSYFCSLQSRSYWGGGLMIQERWVAIRVETIFILSCIRSRQESCKYCLDDTSIFEVRRWPVEYYMRFVRMLESILDDPRCYYEPTVWVIYIQVEAQRGKFLNGRKLYIRAIEACPYARTIWLLVLGDLRRAFSTAEVKDILEKAEQNGVMLRSL